MRLHVNGETREIDHHEGSTLAQVLRNQLGLTGTRVGCGLEQCGACRVLLDGRAVASCTLDATAVDGRSIETVENLSSPRLEALRRAVVAERAGQCGFCLSGIVVSAAELLASRTRPTDAEIREALDANLCRCGAHQRIVRAVLRAAAELDPSDPSGATT